MNPFTLEHFSDFPQFLVINHVMIAYVFDPSWLNSQIGTNKDTLHNHSLRHKLSTCQNDSFFSCDSLNRRPTEKKHATASSWVIYFVGVWKRSRLFIAPSDCKLNSCWHTGVYAPQHERIFSIYFNLSFFPCSCR